MDYSILPKNIYLIEDESMRKYIIRLDDASEHMNVKNWKIIEKILDKYGINPIYGIIPLNKDPDLLKYDKVDGFWDLMRSWEKKGWIPALHGYMHVFETNDGGMNPVNYRSEFAGLPLEKQREKIKKGYEILKSNGINPTVFFAPAHTFDQNTLIALREESNIRIISDTIANKTYKKEGFTFVPQQSGRVRKLPFETVTFCYHPNIMKDTDFIILEDFIKKYNHLFMPFEMQETDRQFGLFDKLLNFIYFLIRR